MLNKPNSLRHMTNCNKNPENYFLQLCDPVVRVLCYKIEDTPWQQFSFEKSVFVSLHFFRHNFA